MAKSDTPYQELDLSRAYRPPHSATWASDKQINGYDTETRDGEIFIISYCFEGFGATTKHNDGESLSANTIWELLTHTQARSALNMWYNLDFDANVIFRHLLDDEEMAVLAVKNEVTTGNYDITYIPNKFLRIKDGNGHDYTHYDASQFFYTSLENAASEWLNNDKLTEEIDAALFASYDARRFQEVVAASDAVTWSDIHVGRGDAWTRADADRYIRDNWRRVLKYARRDAELVRDLWVEAVSVGEDLAIPMGRPFSTGYLAESYLNEHMPEKPGIGPSRMATVAWDAYAGGRFEVLKRGDIGPVAGPDINSAYPHVISNLPDPKTLIWRRHDNPSIDALKNADYGFVNLDVTTDANRQIQPFAVKVGGKLKYPAVESKTLTTLKDIVTFAYDAGYIEDFEINNVWLGHVTKGTQFPFDFVNDLYDKRKSFEADGYEKRGMLLKIILNSMYGKTCQTTPKRESVDGEIDLDADPTQKFVASASLPYNIRQAYQNGILERLEAGSWFNPFIASYITGMTRLELHKQVVNYGLEDNTVMLATDSLMIEKGPFEASNFADDLVTDGLGNWDYDYRGRAFVVGAGVYQIDYPNGDTKLKTRGFNERAITDLRNEAVKANGHIDISSIRQHTFAEAVWQRQELDVIGQLEQKTRKLTADMDDKRRWDKKATFDRLLEGTQVGRPIVVSD